MNRKLIFVISVFVAVGLYLFMIRNRPQKDTGVPLDPEVKSARQLFDLAKSQEKDNELLLSKATYQQILNNYPNYSSIQDVQKRMEGLNMKVIFSPTLITSLSQYYEVKPGDSLNKIAKKFNTTVDLIKKTNLLKSNLIRPRMRLKIWTGKFSLLVDKSQNILMLRSHEEIVKTYTVSTGKNNSTPTGTFKIVSKLIDPVWYRREVGAVVPPTSPENILGSRWMGFDFEGYGIHGTVDPKSLGQQITDGCVRMENVNVEELFSLLPIATEVTIIN